MSHVPCPHCGSSDAGWRFEDGGFYCYKCQVHEAGDGAPPEQKRERRMLNLIDVDVRAVPKRGLNDETCQKWGYGWGDLNGTKVQVAQYRDPAGKVVAQKVRTADKQFKVLGDLSQAGLFGQHLWRDGGRTLVITEGEIDALSVSQVMSNKWPVVSIPNGAQGATTALKKQLEWVEKFSKVVFMFDMDEPGRAGARACAQLLTPGKAFIAELPRKDANEMLVAGESDKLMTAFWEAKQFRPDGLVSGDDVWQHVVRQDLARTIELPYGGLQRLVHGARVGEVTTVVAGTGTGKSTFCRELAAYMIDGGGEKVGYVALEENVRRSVLGILGAIMSERLSLKPLAEVDRPDVKATFDRIKDRVVFYDHFGSLESENLMAKLRFLAKGEGCSVIFLDHLSIVVSGMDAEDDERRAIDKVMTQLAQLANEAQVSIFVVCHLKKPTGGGKTHEEGRPVTLDDLRGSGGIKQLSWNVWSLERDQQDDLEKNISILRVLKCREIGDTGVACKLRYNKDTGRLLEDMSETFGEAEPAAVSSEDFS